MVRKFLDDMQATVAQAPRLQSFTWHQPFVGWMEHSGNVLCDPFCGSAVVAWDLAAQFERPVIAGDIQSFAVARAAAVLTRTDPLRELGFVEAWFRRANEQVARATQGLRIPPQPSVDLKSKFLLSRAAVLRARKYVAKTLGPRLCRTRNPWPVTTAYAGYYFSVQQALTLDALRSTVPERSGERAVALAALIAAAGRCSASPGHTAQPLGIGKSSLPHVIDAWNRSVFDYVAEEIRDIAPRHARMVGRTLVGSWEILLKRLNAGDIAFCDPPYSDVHYSRFYHVLETLSRGVRVSVSGSGGVRREHVLRARVWLYYAAMVTSLCSLGTEIPADLAALPLARRM